MKSDSIDELKRQNFPVYSNAILPKKVDASKLVIDGSGEKAYRGKVIVLIDDGSYSTTEAFAAAFEERGSGILVGKQTFGAMLGMETFPVDKN